jgi:hypothetical protein
MQSNLFPMNKKGEIGRGERLKQRKKERKMEIDKQKERKKMREKEKEEERMRMMRYREIGSKRVRHVC